LCCPTQAEGAAPPPPASRLPRTKKLNNQIQGF
jgi:hypothetical protein